MVKKGDWAEEREWAREVLGGSVLFAKTPRPVPYNGIESRKAVESGAVPRSSNSPPQRQEKAEVSAQSGTGTGNRCSFVCSFATL